MPSWLALRVRTESNIGGRELRLHLDATDALVVTRDANLDVALVSPGRAPRVLDEPVLQATCLVSAVANSEHTMVQCHTAQRVVEDTRLVSLEARLVRFNGDGEGLLGEGSLHHGDVVGLHFLVGRDIDTGGRGLLVGALAALLCVA